MAELDGMRVVVTGSGSGIGAAVHAAVIAAGGIALGADLDLAAAERTAAGSGGEAHRLDVSDPESWAELFATVEPISGLVNCAGIDIEDDDIAGCSAADWDRLMRINLDGAFLGIKAAAESMLTNGIGGSIISISSVLAAAGDGGTLAYAASKAGLEGLTRSVALCLAREGIRCNTVRPGYVRTPMTDRWLDRPDGSVAALEALHPLGRLGEPAEIAATVVYLLSEESSYISGAALAIDGGYTAT